jgi:P-type E1-E2 ATPase
VAGPSQIALPLPKLTQPEEEPGIRERMDQLKLMGLRTVMITGDNPLTAHAIARQAGVEDYIAEATPEKKLVHLRAEQTPTSPKPPCDA